MLLKITKYVVITVSIITAAALFFPFLSAYSGGEESGMLIIRGFNLIEFSAFGIIPILAPLLIPVILYGNQSKTSKERSLILLFLGNMLCYAHGINAAVDWLRTVATEQVSYNFTIIVYPILFIFTLLITKLIETISSLRKEMLKQ